MNPDASAAFTFNTNPVVGGFGWNSTVTPLLLCSRGFRYHAVECCAASPEVIAVGNVVLHAASVDAKRVNAVADGNLVVHAAYIRHCYLVRCTARMQPCLSVIVTV